MNNSQPEYLDPSQSVYRIATANKPLDSDEQRELWETFMAGVSVLENYRIRSGKTYAVADKNFINFNAKLIQDYLTAHTGTLADKHKVKVALKAKDKLVFTNMRLIIQIANKYATTNVDREALIQAGIEGMVKSLLKFKPTSEHKTKNKPVTLSIFDSNETKPKVLEYKVSSYAWFWIRHTITSEVKKSEQNCSTSNSLGYTHIPLDTVDSQGQNLRVEDSEVLGSIPYSIEELQALESSPLEIAIDRGISMEEAISVKARITKEAKEFYDKSIA